MGETGPQGKEKRPDGAKKLPQRAIVAHDTAPCCRHDGRMNWPRFAPPSAAGGLGATAEGGAG